MTVSLLLPFFDPITLFVVILAGLVAGSLVFLPLDINRHSAYSSVVLVSGFLVLLAITGALTGVIGWERWIAAIFLYVIFIIFGFVGKKFTKPALFLRLM